MNNPHQGRAQSQGCATFVKGDSMSFDAFLQQHRTLAHATEVNRMAFWTPLYQRLVEILETNQGDMYQIVCAIDDEQRKTTDPDTRSFWRRKENEFRQAIR
jgi:hypothetical protein